MDEPTAAAFEENQGGTDRRRREGPAATVSKQPREGEGVFCCRDCGETFREEASYLKHCQQHSQGSFHMFVADQLNETLEHSVEKDSETTHFCNVCSLSFVKLNDFHLHMEKEHGQTWQKDTPVQMDTEITKQHTYECSECGKSYGVLGHFLNHQRSHKQASKSVFHDLEHLKKKSFQCESCGRTYSRASALDAHRRCHEGKLVKSRSRSSGDSLNTEDTVVEPKHSENQTDDGGEKAFTCSCGKSFKALVRLKTHQRFSRNNLCSPEETKEKPKKSSSEFYCTECHKTFTGHIALFNHQRWHTNQSEDPAKRFPCEECGKVFMTLTFYYRHQRTAHSDETPSKSFLHQVCQLQKKAFECKDCGLKFSRESALHSHELIHTDVFRETEKEGHMPTSLLPPNNPQNILQSESKETGLMEEVVLLNVVPTHVVEEDPHVTETDEDMESYEPGDLIVKVISASESEDEPTHDLNPDLELICESDQEIRDDSVSELPLNLVSKPGVDLKIVQIDLEQAEDLSLLESEAENKSTAERFECPECYRWFTSASSLRVHRMWHGVRKKRQQAQGQSVAVYTCDMCGHETSSYASHSSHVETHKDETLSNNGSYQAEEQEKDALTCDECGKKFARLSALVSHQLHHPKRKQFQCPDCMMSYSHAANLFNHMKICSAQKKDSISASKKEYNPKKTLLGPKIYHCEQCGKGFWSLGAYSHHKQSLTQCVDLRLRKGFTGASVNGRSRPAIKVACPVCGRKFRHKGIMALHMRKHENGNHKCELCNRSFRLFSSLLRHQVVHNDQLLPPPIKSFQHQVEQLKKNTYSCPDCGKLFSREKALQFHMKSHGYETGHSPPSQKSAVTLEYLQCATCLAHFNNKSSLRAHQKLCIKRENQVACKVEPSENKNTNAPLKASANVDTQGHSAQHLTVDTKMKTEAETTKPDAVMCISETDLKYKCKKCDRSFSVVGALNFHKRIHTEGNKTLRKAKLTMSLLKKPKQEESSKGVFHCSECGRRFMSNSALGSHKRWHTQHKFSHSLGRDDDVNPVSNKTEGGPFKCNKCGKQFFNQCVLHRHRMFNPQCQSADPEKNVESKSTQEQEEFPCPECDQTFVQGSLLATHFESEHSSSLEAADPQSDGSHLKSVEVPEQVSPIVSKSVSPTPKPKAHLCPLCSMTFTTIRGLRAHKWQAHSKGKRAIVLKKKKRLRRVKNPEEAHVGAVTSSDDDAKKPSPVATDRIKKLAPDHTPVKSSSSIKSACALVDPKQVHQEEMQESKQEINTVEAEVSPPVSRLSERTVKCLFKCNKCGKAFQTEEQVGTHKNKAKSRPYCCALCCSGFWTENQLQQHLKWHDEVRGRLPNEVRFRLRAAVTVKPLNPNIPSADNGGKGLSSAMLDQPVLTPESQSQSSHKCQHCGKAFLSPDALQKHETQHYDSDSYHCSVCPRTFSEIQDLIDHHQECTGASKRQTDAPAAASSGDTKGLTCLECGTTFCQETDLHQHYVEHARGAY